MTVISWDRAKTESLRAALNTALIAGKREFTWTEMSGTGFFAKKVADHQIDTGYAKHMLTFLDTQFKTPDEPKRPYNEGEEGQ